ncbi:hypothetical protein RRG08_033393 [Elysia crispata]|uniref:Uncharacterized protein n=1 Tax=Elysia crispata TaxID=231223 RepID=A0AAE1D7E3_9GAST|nr:hypothetical protein RRG08_033393 [Elysia crispata]
MRHEPIDSFRVRARVPDAEEIPDCGSEPAILTAERVDASYSIGMAVRRNKIFSHGCNINTRFAEESNWLIENGCLFYRQNAISMKKRVAGKGEPGQRKRDR